MRDPIEFETPQDAFRALPSYGPAWDAAIEAGVDVAMLLHNQRLSPAQRLAQMQQAADFVADVQRRTVPAHIRKARADERLREKLAALGPERED